MSGLVISFDVTYKVASAMFLLDPTYSPQRIVDELNEKVLMIERNFPISKLPEDTGFCWHQVWGIICRTSDQHPVAVIEDAQRPDRGSDSFYSNMVLESKRVMG